MADKLGEVFSGYVTGVQAFGLFVELDEIYVQGLRARLVDDGRLLPLRREGPPRSRARTRGTSTACGDRVKVQVAAVKLEERKIDFALVDVLERARTDGGQAVRARPARPSRPAEPGPDRPRRGAETAHLPGVGRPRAGAGRRRRGRTQAPGAWAGTHDARGRVRYDAALRHANRAFAGVAPGPA